MSKTYKQEQADQEVKKMIDPIDVAAVATRALRFGKKQPYYANQLTIGNSAIKRALDAMPEGHPLRRQIAAIYIQLEELKKQLPLI